MTRSARPTTPRPRRRRYGRARPADTGGDRPRSPSPPGARSPPTSSPPTRSTRSSVDDVAAELARGGRRAAEPPARRARRARGRASVVGYALVAPSQDPDVGRRRRAARSSTSWCAPTAPGAATARACSPPSSTPCARSASAELVVWVAVGDDARLAVPRVRRPRRRRRQPHPRRRTRCRRRCDRSAGRPGSTDPADPSRSPRLARMAAKFTGFPVEAFEFYDALTADNTKAWWTAHKDDYDTVVRGPIEDLLAELGRRVRRGQDVPSVQATCASPRTRRRTRTTRAPTSRPRTASASTCRSRANGLMVAGGWWSSAADAARALPRRGRLRRRRRAGEGHRRGGEGRPRRSAATS